MRSPLCSSKYRECMESPLRAFGGTLTIKNEGMMSVMLSFILCLLKISSRDFLQKVLAHHSVALGIGMQLIR